MTGPTALLVAVVQGRGSMTMQALGLHCRQTRPSRPQANAAGNIANIANTAASTETTSGAGAVRGGHTHVHVGIVRAAGMLKRTASLSAEELETVTATTRTGRRRHVRCTL